MHVVSQDVQSLEAIETSTLDAIDEKMAQYELQVSCDTFFSFYLNDSSENYSDFNEGHFVELCDQLTMIRKTVIIDALIGNQRREGSKTLNFFPKFESSNSKDVDRCLWYDSGREKFFHKASNIIGL